MKPVEQPPLFPLAAPPPRRKTRRAPAGVVYARYAPKRRTLCDDCVRDIHARGQAVAPLPLTVKWRRTDPDGVSAPICDQHKQTQAGER